MALQLIGAPKKQATVKTATDGSEFIAACTCFEQIIDLCNTLCYLGVCIKEKSYMFGDNKSVIKSSTALYAKLHKRHKALSFHHVREAIAAKYVDFIHMPGTENPADVVSKHWAYSDVWTQLQCLMFWQGDPIDIPDKKKQ